jgi:hypothetical protein
LDRHGKRTLLAPWDGARGSESGCDARRLSTGRSIPAWRTLCGRQIAGNAGRARHHASGQRRHQPRCATASPRFRPSGANPLARAGRLKLFRAEGFIDGLPRLGKLSARVEARKGGMAELEQSVAFKALAGSPKKVLAWIRAEIERTGSPAVEASLEKLQDKLDICRSSARLHRLPRRFDSVSSIIDPAQPLSHR